MSCYNLLAKKSSSKKLNVDIVTVYQFYKVSWNDGIGLEIFFNFDQKGPNLKEIRFINLDTIKSWRTASLNSAKIKFLLWPQVISVPKSLKEF